MNTIKRIVLLFVLFLTQDILLAQTSNITSSVTVVHKDVAVIDQVEQAVINTSPKTTLDNPTKIPTPEEQGFTKYDENGEIFYRKESGSLIIEYKPKN